MRARENKCQISQTDILNMKSSEFHLCFHNSCEIWHLFSRAPMRNSLWCYNRYLIISIALEKCKKNVILFKLVWYKVFVHWKLKLRAYLFTFAVHTQFPDGFRLNAKDVKLFWNGLVQGNWSGVIFNFHCTQMSLVVNMPFIFGDDWNDTPCSSQNCDPRSWYFTIQLHYINFFVYIKIVCKLTIYLTWWSLELQTSAASSVMLHDKHHFHSVWLKRKWMTNLQRKGCLYTCTWKHIAFLSHSVARKLKWVVFFRLHPFLVHEP